MYTRKNLTTCQQDMFATGLYQACQQVYCKVVTHNFCRQIVELQDDNKLLEQLVTTLLSSTTLIVVSCQQAVDNLSTSWEQAVRTHPVDKLLEQHCYKSAAGLLQLVRLRVQM